ELFKYARTLVRAAAEKEKPNGERLPEFTTANLPSVELELLSEEPIYLNYEVVKLENSLTFLVEQLGHDNALVQKVLAGKSQHARAKELVYGSKLIDHKFREELYKGGKKAIDGTSDPMIALAKLVDDESRAVRKRSDTDVTEVKRQAYGQIAAAK